MRVFPSYGLNNHIFCIRPTTEYKYFIRDINRLICVRVWNRSRDKGVTVTLKVHYVYVSIVQ